VETPRDLHGIYVSIGRALRGEAVRLDRVVPVTNPVSAMIRTRVSPAVRTLLAMSAIALAIASVDVCAQGFPGGGGGHGGRGGMRPPGAAPKSNPSAEQAPPTPLATFLGSLRALRMELLVREDQVERWSAMQDALRACTDLEQEAAQPSRGVPADPVQRLHNLVDDARARADAMHEASDSIDAVVASLDDRQRQVFVGRLADAFAGAPRA